MPGWVPTLLRGFEFLAGYRADGSSSSSGGIVIPPREILVIDVTIVSYNVAAIGQLFFNEDIGNNYYSRYVSYAAGGVVATNTPLNSNSGFTIWPIAQQLSHNALIIVGNLTGVEKVMSVNGMLTGTAAAATSPVVQFGGGSWVNTAAQITAVRLTNTAGATFGAGSAMQIYGINP